MSDPEMGERGVDGCTLPTTITSTYVCVCERESEKEGARNRVIGFQILPKPSITKVLTPPQCMLSYRGSWLGELSKIEQITHPQRKQSSCKAEEAFLAFFSHIMAPAPRVQTLSVLSCHFYAYRLEK